VKGKSQKTGPQKGRGRSCKATQSKRGAFLGGGGGERGIKKSRFPGSSVDTEESRKPAWYTGEKHRRSCCTQMERCPWKKKKKIGVSLSEVQEKGDHKEYIQKTKTDYFKGR